MLKRLCPDTMPLTVILSANHSQNLRWSEVGARLQLICIQSPVVLQTGGAAAAHVDVLTLLRRDIFTRAIT